MTIAYQNIVFALAIKALCLILTALGITNMWWGVFATSASWCWPC